MALLGSSGREFHVIDPNASRDASAQVMAARAHQKTIAGIYEKLGRGEPPEAVDRISRQGNELAYTHFAESLR